MGRELTDKQKIFAIEYVKLNNATEAARVAGLKQPHVQGPRLLENVRVKEEINKLRGNLENDLRLVFRKEAEEAFSDLIHMKNKLLKDTVECVKVLSDGSVIRYDATDMTVLRLRRDINESILDRAGYKAVDKLKIAEVEEKKLEDFF